MPIKMLEKVELVSGNISEPVYAYIGESGSGKDRRIKLEGATTFDKMLNLYKAGTYVSVGPAEGSREWNKLDKEDQSDYRILQARAKKRTTYKQMGEFLADICAANECFLFAIRQGNDAVWVNPKALKELLDTEWHGTDKYWIEDACGVWAHHDAEYAKWKKRFGREGVAADAGFYGYADKIINQLKGLGYSGEKAKSMVLGDYRDIATRCWHAGDDAFKPAKMMDDIRMNMSVPEGKDDSPDFTGPAYFHITPEGGTNGFYCDTNADDEIFGWACIREDRFKSIFMRNIPAELGKALSNFRWRELTRQINGPDLQVGDIEGNKWSSGSQGFEDPGDGGYIASLLLDKEDVANATEYSLFAFVKLVLEYLSGKHSYALYSSAYRDEMLEKARMDAGLRRTLDRLGIDFDSIAAILEEQGAYQALYAAIWRMDTKKFQF